MIAAAGVLSGGGLVLAAAPALAHDVLVRTIPADGSTVNSVPPRITLVFAEPALALGTAVEITGPDGSVASGNAVLAGSTVGQGIQAGAPAGKYLVRWRVTSDDGHPVTGSFSFTAGQAGGGSQSAAPSRSSGPTATNGSAMGLIVWAVFVVIAVAVLGSATGWFRPGRRREVETDE
jgi:copper resistance protein C